MEKSTFRQGRRACWLEELPGIEIFLTRLDHSATLRSWPREKRDSRVLMRTKLDMDRRVSRKGADAQMGHPAV